MNRNADSINVPPVLGTVLGTRDSVLKVPSDKEVTHPFRWEGRD
jgi:hypothetical protein